MAASGCHVGILNFTATIDGSWRQVPYSGTDVVDTDSYHDPSTNNTRITVPETGRYLIYGWLGMGQLGGNKHHRFRIDGDDSKVYAENAHFATSPALEFTGYPTLYGMRLNAGQYIEHQYKNATGGTQSNNGAALTVLRINDGGDEIVIGDLDGESIASGYTSIPITAREDPSSMVDSVTSSRINIPTTGLWVLAGSVKFSENFTSDRDIFARWALNGSALAYGESDAYKYATGGIAGPMSVVVASLTAGDYVEFQVNHQDGTSRTVGNGCVVVFPIVVGAEVYRSSDGSFAHLADITWNAEAHDASGYHAANAADCIVPSGKDGIHMVVTSTRSTGGTYTGGHQAYKTGGGADTPFYRATHYSIGTGNLRLVLADLQTSGDDRKWIKYFHSDGGSGTVYAGSHMAVARCEEFTYADLSSSLFRLPLLGAG